MARCGRACRRSWIPLSERAENREYGLVVVAVDAGYRSAGALRPDRAAQHRCWRRCCGEQWEKVEEHQGTLWIVQVTMLTEVTLVPLNWIVSAMSRSAVVSTVTAE